MHLKWDLSFAKISFSLLVKASHCLLLITHLSHCGSDSTEAPLEFLLDIMNGLM